ncbi:ABC transporter permease [Acidobacteriota bacterium]
MIKNYIKTALRNLFKHKGYSLINIAGLAIGMASCLLILFYVQHELSYDNFNEKTDQIYRVAGSYRYGGRDFELAVSPGPMAEVMVKDYPEVIDAVRFFGYGNFIVQHKDNSFKEKRVFYTDPSFFNIFSVPLLEGNPETALASPNMLVLSQNTAKKYFGEEDPIGKTLKINNDQDYEVTGVFQEIPDNSHFHFDMLISLSSHPVGKDKLWINQNLQTYILLHEKADPKGLEAKFPDLIMKYMAPQFEAFMGASMDKLVEDGELRAEMYLQPLRDIHLHSDLLGEMEPTSDVKYVYIFSAIALFILIIASINFMNLSTARSAGRAREVGIRKVLGSYRRQLIGQFLTESMVLSFVSMAIAVLLVWLALPLFNSLSGKAFSLSNIGQGPTLLALVLVTSLTGFFAGSYPAFFISAFRPANVLKGQMRSGEKAKFIRRGLVVFQFMASIILIIGTFIVYNQLNYIQNKKLGFNKEQVLVLENTYLLEKQIETFKNEILSYPQITNATISGFLPVPSDFNQMAVFPEGDTESEKSTSMQIWGVDHDYIETLGMNILEGRDFSREFSTDKSAVVINQEVARHFGWEKPLGKRLATVMNARGDTSLFTVIGVVEDFHFQSLRNNIGPLIMLLFPSTSRISFRMNTEDFSGTISLIQKKWREFLPNQPFEYSFLDEAFDSMYRAEKRIGEIFGIFAILAVLIGCLGLFGLAAFMAEQRTKEIGIRKVLGATASKIIRLLVKEFVILIALANAIAWPVAYLVMKGWLKDFAYQTPVQVWLFLLTGVLTLLIALITVSYQAVKAALANPVDSIKFE